MLYTDWHFCSNLQLTSQETADYLDVLFILRQNSLPLRVRMTALEKLEQSDLLWQAYAIPDLVDLLFSESSRKTLDETRDEELVIRFRGSVKGMLRRMVEECEKDSDRHEAFLKMIGHMDSSDESRILTDLVSAEDIKHTVARNRAYLQIAEYVPDLITLELLNLLSEYESDKVREIVSENLEDMFLSARAGDLGLLPCKIALEIDCKCERDISEIEACFPEDWLSQPEFMEILARCHLCDDANTPRFDAIRAELETLELFQKCNSRGISKDIPLWFLGDNMDTSNKHVLCAVLWQSILWELAWEASPEQFLVFASGIWSPPRYLSHRVQYTPQQVAQLNWITRQMLFAMPAVSIDEKNRMPSIRQAVLTAWQYCANPERLFRNDEKPFQSAPYMRHGRNALHAFAAASLLRRIFTEYPSACYDEEKKKLRNQGVLRLILNLGFVLESSGPRKERLSSRIDYIWPRELRGLSCYAYHCITELGVGNICRALPRYLVMDILNGNSRITNQDSPKRLKNPQFLAMYGYQGLLVCANWIIRAQSLYTVSRSGVSGSPWEEPSGDQDFSCVDSVCNIIFSNNNSRYWQIIRQHPNALSLFALNKYQSASRGRKMLSIGDCEPWYEQCLRGLSHEDKITIYHVLQSPTPSQEVWKELSCDIFPHIVHQTRLDAGENNTSDLAWQISAGAWELILTQRLCCILEQPEMWTSGQGQAWVDEWYDTLSGAVTLRENPVLFYELLCVLQCEPRIPDNLDADKNPLSRILSLIVQMVDIFTEGENACFQYLLGLTLSDANPAHMSCLKNESDDVIVSHPGFGIGRLYQACADHLIALERKADRYPYAVDLQYSFLNHILSWPEENASSGWNDVSQYMQKYYRRQCATSRSKDYFVQAPVTGEEWDPLRDRFLQRQDDRYVSARQRIDFDKVKNPFSLNAERLSGNRVLGLIESKKRLHAGRNGNGFTGRSEISWEYTIRIGRQTISCPSKTSFMIGDLASVDQTKNPAQLYFPYWQRQDERDRLLVNIIKISITGIILQDNTTHAMLQDYLESEIKNEIQSSWSEVQKRKAERLSEVLDIWTPDTLSYEEGGTYRLGQGNTCEVVYNEGMKSYLPVERNMFRLLLDEFYGHREKTIRMFFISGSVEHGVRGMLFSVSPGFNYRLSELDWTEDSYNTLVEQLLQDDDSYGTSILAHLSERNGFPVLELIENAFDFRNREWARLFEGNDAFCAINYGNANSGRRVYRVSKIFPSDSAIEGATSEIQIYVDLKSNLVRDEIQNCELAANGWNRLQQRRRMVKADIFRNYSIPFTKATDVKLIAKLLDLKPGDIVQTAPMFKPLETRTGYIRVFMNDTNIPMQCAVESISLVPNGKSTLINMKDLLSARSCIIENVFMPDSSKLNEGNVIPVERLPERLQTLPENVNELRGIVVDMPAPSKTSGGHESLNYKVSILYDQEVVSANFSGSDFACLPTTLGCKVIIRRGEDGWRATAVQQSIYIRALWSAKNHIERGIVPEGISLGVMNIGRDRRSHYVTQDSSQPVLHVWPVQSAPPEDHGPAGLRIGNVHVIGRNRICDWSIFKYAKYFATAQLCGKDQSIRWGDAKYSDFYGSLSGMASIRIYEIDGLRERYQAEMNNGASDSVIAEHMPIYDARVVFEPRRQGKPFNNDPQKNQDNLEWYQEWYQGDARLLVGRWVAETPNKKAEAGGLSHFHLEERPLPPAVKADITTEWLWDIPFLEGSSRQVWGPHLFPDNSRARARLVEVDGHWEASCLTVEPFRLGEDLIAEFMVDPDGLIDQPDLYMSFAGVLADEHTGIECLRFEWGYGYTFLVPRKNIVDEDFHPSDTLLFFGDRIRKFYIAKRDNEWYLRLPSGAIEHMLVHHLWHDAGNNVVQLLKVHVDIEHEQIYTSDVSMVEYTIGHHDRIAGAWFFDRISFGQMEEDSKSRLLKETKEDFPNRKAVDRMIFAILVMDRPTDQQRPPLFSYLSLKNRNDVALLAGKIVCLVAGDVETTARYSLQRQYGNFVPKQRNDFMLKFYLDTEVPFSNQDRNGEADERSQKITPTTFIVNVSRRKFSLDESKLRVIYSREQEDSNAHQEYRGSKMLVHLEDTDSLHEKNGRWEWSGYVKGICLREPNALREWVRGRNDCLVTLGIPYQSDNTNARPEKLLVEVAPGITSEISTADVVGNWRNGATALLELKDDILKAYVILPGDEEYIPNSGRVLELLIMDGAANNYGQESDAIPGAANQGQFTVAGFPQLMFRNPELLGQLIHQGWPRLAIVKRGERGNAVDSEMLSENWFAAVIECEASSENPRLRYYNADSTEDKCLEKPWSQLSFMDAPSGEILQSLKHGTWHYHDRTFSIRDSENNRLTVHELPRGTDYRKFLVFPGRLGNLRFDSTEFKSRGFSVRELIENGIPGKSRTRTYAIAGYDEQSNSIWLEAFPGRIMEVPCRLLFVKRCGVSLEHFPIYLLSPGDTITLEEGSSFKGGIRTLNVSELHYGLRGGLYQPKRHRDGTVSPGALRAILPVLKVLEDGLLLGDPQWNMYYPLPGNETVRYQKGDAVALELDNTLKQEEKLYYGNVGLLDLNAEGQFRLFGVEQYKVCLSSYENDWNATQWIKDLLGNLESRRALFNALGEGAKLPVKCRFNEDLKTIWVFRSQEDRFPEGAVLYGVILGYLENSKALKIMRADEPIVIIRAGKNLLSVPCSRILPELTPEQYRAVIEVLRQKGIWLHMEEDGWHSGVQNARQYASATPESICLLEKVPKAQGFLCMSRQNMEFLWLPYGNACLTGRKLGVRQPASHSANDALGDTSIASAHCSEDEEDVERIWEAFTQSAKYNREQERGTRTGSEAGSQEIIRKALILPGRIATLINVNRAKLDSELLSTGTKCRIMPLVRLEQRQTQPMLRYIAEVYPQGEMILLFTERSDEARLGEVVSAEVSKRLHHQVRAVLKGMRRERQNLTKEVHSAYYEFNRCCSSDVNWDNINKLLWSGVMEMYRMSNKQAKDDIQRMRGNTETDRRKAWQLQAQCTQIKKQCEDMLQWDYPQIKQDYGNVGVLIYLCCFLSGFQSPVNELYRRTRRECDYNEIEKMWIKLTRAYLKHWFEGQGARLMQIQSPTTGNSTAVVEAFSVLTVILLLDAIMGIDRNSNQPDDVFYANARKLSVHILRMLGIAAEMSVQQEVLLRYWFKQGRPNTGLWRCLNSISIGGERTENVVYGVDLTSRMRESSPVGNNSSIAHAGFNGTLSTSQLHKLVTQCEHILHLDMNIAQSSVDIQKRLAVTQSLLYSVRSLHNYDAYEKTLEWLSGNHGEPFLMTWELAKLGRALIPKAGDEIAMDYLPESIVAKVRTLWDDQWQQHLPCLLITTPVPLKSTDEIRNKLNKLCF